MESPTACLDVSNPSPYTTSLHIFCRLPLIPYASPDNSAIFTQSFLKHIHTSSIYCAIPQYHLLTDFLCSLHVNPLQYSCFQLLFNQRFRVNSEWLPTRRSSVAVHLFFYSSNVSYYKTNSIEATYIHTYVHVHTNYIQRQNHKMNLRC